MVSQERIAREQAQEEMHWQRAALNSIERQLERTLEAGDAAEDEYWALRRQRSFGTMLGQLPEPEPAPEPAAAPGTAPALASQQLHPGGAALPPPPTATPAANTSAQLPPRSPPQPARGTTFTVHPGGSAPLPPPPGAGAEQQLSQVRSEISQLQEQLELAPTPAPPAGGARARANAARQHQAHEAFWAQESALRRQTSLGGLGALAAEEEAQQAAQTEEERWEEMDLWGRLGAAASELIPDAGKRAASEALAIGKEVAEAAAEVSADMRQDVSQGVSQASAEVMPSIRSAVRWAAEQQGLGPEPGPLLG